MKTVAHLSLIALLLAGLAAPASAAPAAAPVGQDDSSATFARARMYPGWCLINPGVCYEPWGKIWHDW